jgi:hypothetical protein
VKRLEFLELIRRRNARIELAVKVLVWLVVMLVLLLAHLT